MSQSAVEALVTVFFLSCRTQMWVWDGSACLRLVHTSRLWIGSLLPVGTQMAIRPYTSQIRVTLELIVLDA